MSNSEPRPTTINLHKKSRILEICFDDDSLFEFNCEFLRVYSPSADVKGHGPDQAVLQTGKENVSIIEVEPIGNYAIKLHFDDGHNTGIYSWSYLYDMGKQIDHYWQNYLAALKEAGYERKPSK